MKLKTVLQLGDGKEVFIKVDVDQEVYDYYKKKNSYTELMAVAVSSISALFGSICDDEDDLTNTETEETFAK